MRDLKTLPILPVTLSLILAFAALDRAYAQSEGRASAPDAKESSSKAWAVNSARGSGPGEIAEDGAVDDSDSKPQNAVQSASTSVPALNGERLIHLSAAPRHLLLYGMGLTGAYDDRIGDTQRRVAGGVSLWSPYVGFVGSTHKAQYVFQYAPTVTHYASGDFGTKVFHRASFFMAGAINGRWDWFLSTSNSYGDDSLRLLAPLQFNPLGNTPIADISSATFQLGSETVFGSKTNLALGWRRSPRDHLTFVLGESYYSYSREASHTSVANFRLNYDHAVSPRTNFQVFGQVHRALDRSLCSSYGGGVGMSTRPNQRMTLQLSAGPEFNRPNCGRRQALSFHGALAAALSQTSRMYVAANREFATAYRARSQWEDNVAVGFDKRLSRILETGFDTGYARSQPVDASSAYQGYFVASYVRWRLSRSLSTEANFRHFYRLIAGQSLNRNVVMFGLEWSPAPVGLF